ncbi:unnamed protein product [Candida verbasci]|uniref:Uncharacterized protein n=1 Tax=Candida verbasci TaxID=1227364 RepID=A0A9W4TXU5_9ASCO|nr:unnamed protein product [Candida verbasci]
MSAAARSFQMTVPKAVLIAGVGYGLLSIYMSKYYFKNSSIRKIYVDSDSEYSKVHPMHKIQYEGNYLKEKENI